MSTAFIMLIVGVAGAIVALGALWYRRAQAFDLGVLSDHWLAEQRFGPGHDSQR